MDLDNINIEGLCKYYGKFIALEDINLSIKKGEILGVIGSNGNGKSTLLNCITGVLNYEKGNIYIDGMDLKKKPLVCKQKMAYCTDESNAYEIMSGEEYLVFVGSVYKVKNEDFIERYNKLVEDFNMHSHMNKLIKYYSHGTKQKISIMAALIHDPDIWILDEPLIGLDSKSIKVLFKYFKDYKKANKTIVVTIHDVDTAIKISDRIALIKDGRLLKIYNNVKSDKSIKTNALRIMSGAMWKELEQSESND